MMSKHQPAFDRALQRLRQDERFGGGWIIKSGLWPAASSPKGSVLKLQKPHWSNDPPDALINTSGVFFSVWTDAASRLPDRLHYNVHALKLRELRGYALESRKFAAAFRTECPLAPEQWPNVSTDFGPQTLMEGFTPISAESCEATVIGLCAAFLPAADAIEAVLKKAAV